ncbi:MAG: Mur ligase family protein, partial [Chloroflexota bacterium]
MLLIILLCILWWGGTCVRIYQQGRFYQIEEYQSLRYLRWLLRSQEHLAPTRGMTMGAGGAVAGLFVGDTNTVTFLVLAIAGVAAVYPQAPGEIKKEFKRTKRANRLLGASFAVALVLMVIVALVSSTIGNLEIALVTAYTLGLIVWWTAPLQLVLGNALMAPVEANIRNGFKRQARAKLDQVQPKVIGITGSYGKTSTKTYIAHILNGKYNAFPTPKSWNTIMGVCLAINTRLNDDADYFICEMGAYIPGEIQEIAALTHPSISIVTEVGPQHLERFGTLENIAIAKYEII